MERSVHLYRSFSEEIKMQAEYKLTLPAATRERAELLAANRLAEAQSKLSFVPNMYAGMANSPGLLDTYIHGYEHFRELSGFTPAEQEVVLLAISRENGCTYCMAAHSFLADKVSGVPVEVTDAIRDGKPIPDTNWPPCTTSLAPW
jgi:AhpD family alkylhydroperoxidase